MELISFNTWGGRVGEHLARVADRLLDGLEVREIADRLGITFETCRFHLKRIFSKTSTRRQAELIRLMLSLPGQ